MCTKLKKMCSFQTETETSGVLFFFGGGECVFFCFYYTHNISHFTHHTQQPNTFRYMTEFVKHGTEYDNGYSKYQE